MSFFKRNIPVARPSIVLSDAEISQVYGAGMVSGSDINMLDLGSLVSRRQTLVQLTTNMMSGQSGTFATISKIKG